MTKIFISYRRADTQYVTDIVYDKMAQHFGKENVFLDVGSIPFGVDFRQYLNEQVSAHDVVLVIIGTEWARMMQERAEQKNDFVRIEIESALQQEKLVIPVLVKNATMPNFIDLPVSIHELQWRNSAVIRRQPDLENDCSRLAEGIHQYFNLHAETTPPKKVQSTKTATPSKPTSISLMPQPFDWIEIPNKGYSIAKYPITNAQFAKFIESGGYENKQWWTKEGWKKRLEGWHYDDDWKASGSSWTEPLYWQDSKWNGDIQSVVGVSWYEAIAFCLWLSDATNEKIMLPTDYQWQHAAQEYDGRVYPWGNDWNSALCKSSVDENGIARTTAVNAFEGKGDSPFGVVDMAGNIWEWCLTDYENKSNDMNSTARYRVLRGGSWNSSDMASLRCDFRYGNNVNLRLSYGGFRITRFN